MWLILFHDDFIPEFEDMGQEVRVELLANLQVIKKIGPILGRPIVDTLKGSRYANMKELRFQIPGGVWRVAFAFDPDRSAIVLVAGNKIGKPQAKFYKNLISKADKRFGSHLSELKARETCHEKS